MRKNYDLEKRRYVIGGTVCLLAFIYLIRLFILQVPDNDYKIFADSNAFLKKIQYPSRGLIYDRNGELLVFNQPAYDLMMIKREVQPFDTVDFCNTLSITRAQFDKRMENMQNRRLNPGYSAYTPQTFIAQLSAKDYGLLQEKLYKFTGFYTQKRILRQYKFASAPNILGNIREVSPKDIERDDYYAAGDYTGDLGVEKSYEKVLRGEKGVEILLRDAHGRIQNKEKYKNGMYDVVPVPGRNLKLSIDIGLQQYGEYLMQNKIGAVVAIEPSTGEILAMVSTPTYDPSILIGRERGKNYMGLNKDPLKPLFDRAIMACYPPGSTFKPTQGLVFLQENVISQQTTYPCNHGFVVGGLRVGCHPHAAPLPLIPALQTSCNAYFCYGLRNMLENRQKYPNIHTSFDLWKDYMVSMGYGYTLGVDLPGEKRGFIPNSKFYSKIYGERGWRALTIISVAIGQGEILSTPLQICNLAATIANRGHYFTPHVVREIQDSLIDRTFTVPHFTKVDKKYYDPIVEGMRNAVLGGTCRLAAIPDVEVCGKTGTAQNPHGKDHSAFIGFAPMNNPRIAIVAYIENAGWGASFGVPIGSLMMEKYLKGSIDPSRQWLEDNMVNSNTIIFSGIKRN